MRILVTMPAGYVRDTFLSKKVACALEALGEVIWNQSAQHWSAEQLQTRLPGIDVCITGWGTARYDAPVLAKADRLQLIVHTGGTVAPLVSPALYARGVRVVSGNDGFARSVAEGVIAYMLLGLRRLPHFMAGMQKTGWVDPLYYNEGLLDQTVGLIGFGSVARYLLALLARFETTVKVYSKHMTQAEAQALGVQKASIEEIMRTCRIVSLHCANTPENHHLIDRPRLEMMQNGALLVNTARGDVLDETALAAVCAAGKINAVLDVYEKENPLPATSPLWNLENVILLPHLCGPTVDQRQVIGLRLVREIEKFQKGEALTMEIDAAAAARMTIK